ncbi:MAG: type II toxin-antitoxin system HipA family toxin YjjJ [Scandinavium sp.]|uniref:type II toxin-antitoxin system HipA family toxin YjjJ n=1 Tax=Scandinavium sp. TaxID=2830653 RepID=UPI003F31495B
MSAFTDLLLQGPRSAPELRNHLNISQATFSRQAAAEEHVVQFGRARATRYALRRPVRGINEFPLWQVDDAGKAWTFGVLTPCWPRGSCLVALNNGEWQWFSGLPWYLSDLRPQGFIGRAWGRRLAAQLALPEDIRLWQEDDILFALSLFSGENQGGWLIGETGYQQWLQAAEPTPIPEEGKLQAYAELARDALAGEVAGSSAGGEQPKFTCLAQRDSQPVQMLVKFTAPQPGAVTRRWADLLIAESVALDVLRNAGIAASQAQVLRSEAGQVFLESRRFDCEGVVGRRALVSLEAVQSEFGPSTSQWPQTVAGLEKQKQVTPETAQSVEKVWAFGRLIANSDMHAGNLSFYLSDAPLLLTPVYDMLPMAFAPTSAGAMREESLALKIEPSVSRGAWMFAFEQATLFWQQVADDARISAAFRQIAKAMQKELLAVKPVIDRLA